MQKGMRVVQVHRVVFWALSVYYCTLKTLVFRKAWNQVVVRAVPNSRPLTITQSLVLGIVAKFIFHRFHTPVLIKLVRVMVGGEAVYVPIFKPCFVVEGVTNDEAAGGHVSG
jgi:hypothetical protein